MKFSKRSKWLIAILLLGGAGWYVFGHSNSDEKSGKKGGKNAAIPVAVAAAKAMDIPVYLQGLGNITPRSNVIVHTRVDGQLMTVNFQEGQLVKKDDLLAQIDDRPYIAALEQAQGALDRDKALLQNAKLDLERYKTLWSQDSVARQQLDAQASLVKQDEGAVLNDQGQVDSAKTNLIYTKITSPVNGRVGLRQVDAGNIVHASDANGIVIVAELQPITALFTIPEDNLPDVNKHINANDTLAAEAWDRDNKNKLADGTLIAVDNQVDSTTGTVKLRAQFSNEDNALFPSQFVNIRLKLDTLKDAITIPNAAIQNGTKGAFVYLAKPDNTVTVQPITIGPADGENVSISQGVSVGDQLVIDGADGLREGAKIEIETNDGKATENTKSDTAPHHKHKKDQDNADKDKTP